MLSIIYLFIILVAFIIYKVMCEYENFNKGKSTWNRLIYWGIVIFISAIFNVTLYINNTDNYKISFYLDEENLHLVAFIIIMYLVIQVLSPTLFKGRIARLLKKSINQIKFSKDTKSMKKGNVENNYRGLDGHNIKNDIDSSEDILKCNKVLEKNKNQYYDTRYNDVKALQEKHFEIFLNTFCWLSFSYIIFIQLFFSIVNILQCYNVALVLRESFISNFINLQNNLNDIGCFLMLLMIPVSLRQIIYYLFKLKEDQSDRYIENQEFLKNHPQYEVIQKRLVKNNKKL